MSFETISLILNEASSVSHWTYTTTESGQTVFYITHKDGTKQSIPQSKFSVQKG